MTTRSHMILLDLKILRNLYQRINTLRKNGHQNTEKGIQHLKITIKQANLSMINNYQQLEEIVGS